MSGPFKQESFLLERYKYVLGQKKSLNERTFKIVAIYQTLFLAVCAAQFKVASSASDGKLRRQVAADASWGLFIVASLVTILMFLLVFGGILSWLKYRRDEAEIDAIVGSVLREPPHLLDAMKWYESYILLAGGLGLVGYYAALVYEILPFIRSR